MAKLPFVRYLDSPDHFSLSLGNMFYFILKNETFMSPSSLE